MKNLRKKINFDKIVVAIDYYYTADNINRFVIKSMENSLFTVAHVKMRKYKYRMIFIDGITNSKFHSCLSNRIII